MNRYIYIGDNKIAVIDEVILGYLNDINKDCYPSYFKDYDNTIEVNGTHSWEINQILVEDVDFYFIYQCWRTKAFSGLSTRDKKYYNEYTGNKKAVAVPISKPNTDVKQDQKQHLKDIMEADEKDGLYDENLVSNVQNSEGSSLATLSSSSSNSDEQKVDVILNYLGYHYKVNDIRNQKNNAVRKQDFASAAQLRDDEVKYEKTLDMWAEKLVPLLNEKLIPMPNNVPNPEVCDATDDDQRTKI